MNTAYRLAGQSENSANPRRPAAWALRGGPAGSPRRVWGKPGLGGGEGDGARGSRARRRERAGPPRPGTVGPECSPAAARKPSSSDGRAGLGGSMAAQPETAPPERAAWRRWSPFRNRASVRPAESSWQVPLSTKWGLAAARFQFVSMWVLSLGRLLHWVELEHRPHRDDGLVMRWAASYDFGVPFSLRWLNTSEEEFNPVTPNFREQGVIDDRGKFIYITPEEMAAVGDFTSRDQFTVVGTGTRPSPVALPDIMTFMNA